MKQSGFSLAWRKATESRLFLPLVALALILLFDLITIPGFFSIQTRDGNLYGSLIDIVRNGSTVALLAIGMTLVIATGGVDLSVGAIMAIAASVAALLMNPYVLAKELPPHLMSLINDPTFTFQPLWVVILATLLVATLCGVWNGILVAYVRIQAMVATLILMIAGRGIAQLITNGVRIQIFYEPYAFIGQGWIVLPVSVYIVAIVFVLAWLFTRKTAIGLFIESVGVNFRSSYFAGISEKRIKLLAYTFCGFCAGIAGLVDSSNIKTSDAYNLGMWLEMDAILAVVIGGTLMSGGRFSLFASIVGAWVIQAISTSMYAFGVPAFALQAIKAVVVIFVILLYSEQARSLVQRISAQKGA
ncbi:MAG: ABC transporter permease [Anaerolineaceae bacterium]|jgi:simple sugar transport system permease protein|nr:ABC transporter permease [Anaerolineae bacterium]MDX9832340.1 ABC transporter permease [Anaerolineae bacterium]NLF14405.1 ABC transporter permease [Anaerolineaceae bacterium]